MLLLPNLLLRRVGVPALIGLLPLAANSGAQVLFQPPLVSDGGGDAARVVVGDVDEDGLPDAIVSRRLVFSFPPSVLCRGAGDGSCGAPEPIATLGAGTIVTSLADFDEDGHLDVVVLGDGTPPLNAAVRLGDGTGGFGAPLGINTNDSPAADADVGDFDADGNLDVAIYNENQFLVAGSLSVAFGHGDGTFEPSVRVVIIGLQAGAGSVVRAGDTNGDGFDDIVFTNTAPVMLSNGDRSFSAAPCAGCYAFYVPDLVLADLNGDGRDDAVTPTAVLLAQPSGAFGAPQALASPFVPVRVGVADLDGDGPLDLAIARSDTTTLFADSSFGDVVIRRGNGDGTFQAVSVVISHVAQARGLVVADMDLDGRPDLVAADMQPAPKALTTLLNATYGPGSPYTDLGGALAGSHGAPIQLATGTLLAGQPFTFRLANGKPNGVGYHVFGISLLAAPFKGGTLIPLPYLLNGPLLLDAGGGVTVGASMPAGLSGLTFWVQFWMPNAGGPVGFAASSGLRGVVP